MDLSGGQYELRSVVFKDDVLSMIEQRRLDLVAKSAFGFREFQGHEYTASITLVGEWLIQTTGSYKPMFYPNRGLKLEATLHQFQFLNSILSVDVAY
jgi:hypothetical protein